MGNANNRTLPPNCETCGVHTKLLRRHHCRQCGRQNCASCSTKATAQWVCKKPCGAPATGGVLSHSSPSGQSGSLSIQPTPSQAPSVTTQTTHSATTISSATTTTASVTATSPVETGDAKLEGGQVHGKDETPAMQHANHNASVVANFSPSAQVAFTPLNSTSLSCTPSSFLPTRTSSGDGSGSSSSGTSLDSNSRVLPNTSTPSATTSATVPNLTSTIHNQPEAAEMKDHTNLSTEQKDGAIDAPAVTFHMPVETDAKESKVATEPRKGKSDELADFRSNLINFSTIPYNWLVVVELMLQGVSEKDEGPVHALRACLKLLKNLYYFDVVLVDDEEMCTRWRNVRERIRIGLIKDTQQHGNTSVSMGAAQHIDFEESVGLLNCGTGGIKYQLYAKRNGMLYLKAEFKPKDGASPNALLGVGSYVPKNGGESFERTNALLQAELDHPELPWHDQTNVPIYAFVTGTVRQHWEEAKEDEKKVMESEMENLFEPYGIKKLDSGSYFMTQDAEGHLELVGSKAMYDNLTNDHLLDAGTTVVGSFGIGRGSCQWMVMTDGQPELIAHKAGMTNLQGLANVGNTVIDEYRNNRPKFLRFLEALERVDFPVFALKSGCALLLENKNYSYVKAQLVAPVPVEPEKTVSVARNGSGEVVECTYAGSKDLLCAVAGIKLGGMDLEIVYHSDGRRVMPSEEIVAGHVYYFAPLGEEFKQPEGSASSTELQLELTTTDGDQNVSTGSNITQSQDAPSTEQLELATTEGGQNTLIGSDITQSQSAPSTEQLELPTTEADQSNSTDIAHEQQLELATTEGDQHTSIGADITQSQGASSTEQQLELKGDQDKSIGSDITHSQSAPSTEQQLELAATDGDQNVSTGSDITHEQQLESTTTDEDHNTSIGFDITQSQGAPSTEQQLGVATTEGGQDTSIGSDITQSQSAPSTEQQLELVTTDGEQSALIDSDVKSDSQPQEADGGSTNAPDQEQENVFASTNDQEEVSVAPHISVDPSILSTVDATTDSLGTSATLDSAPMDGTVVEDTTGGDNGFQADTQSSSPQLTTDQDQNASLDPITKANIQSQEIEEDIKVSDDVFVRVNPEGGDVLLVVSTTTPDIPIETDAASLLASPPEPVVEEAVGDTNEVVHLHMPKVVSPPTEAKVEKRKEDYSNEFIALETVVYKWLITTHLMRQSDLPEKDKGPVHALHATLVLLKNLWYLDHFLPPNLGEKWRSLRIRVRIGLIKDTKRYGNTSVSMGAATTVSFATSVGFLNCGTGGIKYQLYTLKNGILFLEAEYKPKDGASPNAMLGLDGYKPKGEGATLAQTQALLAEELKNAPWALKENEQPIPVYAFVTGTVRQCWEESKGPEQRAQLESAMQTLFEPFGIQKLKESYFMSQDVEGDLELSGTRVMYSNLEQAGLLPKGTTVVGSSGIGRGSCQWMVMGKEGEAQLIAHKAGMTNLPELAKLGENVISTYASDNERAIFLMEALEAVQLPVLALKSGCALLLENKDYAHVKAELVAPVSVGIDVPVRVARRDDSKAVECVWKGSLSRFCAEAAFALELSHHNFETVYRSSTGEEIVSDSAAIASNELLFVASLNETDAALL